MVPYTSPEVKCAECEKWLLVTSDENFGHRLHVVPHDCRVKPKIICLCGSSRFVREMAVIGWEFEKDGNIVLGLHLLPIDYPNCPPDHLAEHENVKEKMDELHKRKIDLSDEIFVVNINGYIGESTKSEIEYANVHNKKVIFLEPLKLST